MGGPTLNPVPDFSPRDFRNALGRFASGVTVVTTHHENHTHGMTANAFVSVSLDPPLVLVSLDNRSNMHRLLPLSRRYGVSVLGEHQEILSNHFAGKPVEGLQPGFTMREGIPLLDNAVAHFLVEVTDVHPAGDHTLYLGRVTHFAWNENRPLLFFGGRYHHLHAHKPEPGEHEMSLFSIGEIDAKSVK